jgi:hypothetical protein
MNIDEATARDIKVAVRQLHETAHGKLLLEFLWDRAGYWSPTYDPTSQLSVNLAAGRTEMMQIIRNLERLTEEQIVELCQEGQ